MKSLAPKIVLSVLLSAFAPAALAHCGPVQQGHTQVGCEQGVTVFRTNQAALPRISPTDSARLQLQREQLAQRRVEADDRARFQRQKLELHAQRLRQQGYLYRDANSPLRRTGYGQYGFGVRGINSQFVGGFAPPRRGRNVRRAKH